MSDRHETLAPALSNFLTDIIDADLASGRHQQVVTRFPPEPNGYLHIGHAKSICLNFGLAAKYGGACHLRFDDTNPLTEDDEFVRSIQNDVRWLGFAWTGEVRFASDYFERFWELANVLVDKGLAYVDEQPGDAIRDQRGTITEAGTASPFRDRTIDENRAAFRRMREGGYPDGGAVLRARIDMASPNLLMRDPILYRVRHARHHRTGDTWCIYPMYDYAHGLEDAIEGVTHSICTLEFENNRELYDWVVQNTGCIHPDALAPPRQYEFARLRLGYTVMSKRKFITLVDEGHVSGWDDPRMPTLAGLRRRGVRPEAIRAFAEMIGVAKSNSTVDIGKLEYCIRDDLNRTAPRMMAVLRPLKVVLTNLSDAAPAAVDAPIWPEDVGLPGTRALPLSRELFIDRDDFHEDPPAGWHRLAPGREVRLRHAWVIRCDEVVRDDAGSVIELRCSVDEATLGAPPAGRRVKGVIHWVSAAHARRAEIRLYDRLFRVEKPDADADADFRTFLNPESLVVVEDALVEPALVDALAADDGERRFQFERIGFFHADPVDSRPDHPVFNRIVTLKDSWIRAAADDAAEEALTASTTTTTRSGSDAGTTADDEKNRPAKKTRAEERAIARERNPDLADAMARLIAAGLSEEQADVLSGDVELAAFAEEALAAVGVPRFLTAFGDSHFYLEMYQTSPVGIEARRWVARGSISRGPLNNLLPRWLIARGPGSRLWLHFRSSATPVVDAYPEDLKADLRSWALAVLDPQRSSTNARAQTFSGVLRLVSYVARWLLVRNLDKRREAELWDLCRSWLTALHEHGSAPTATLFAETSVDARTVLQRLPLPLDDMSLVHAVAKWATNDLLRLTAESSVASLKLTPASFADVVARATSGAITAQGGRELLDRLARDGGDVESLVASMGLAKVDDRATLAAAVASVVAAHPDEHARYRAGKVALLGFFTGKAMAAAGKGADARVVRELLLEALGPVDDAP